MKRLVCPSCGMAFAYDIETCTFCGAPLEASEPETARVLAVTRIETPSTGHEDVPYWCALVDDEAGARAILKLERSMNVGDEIALTTQAMARTYRVGIVGSGVMARGLAEMLLFRGHTVVWAGRSLERLEASKADVVDRLARVMDEVEVQAATERCRVTTDYAEFGACEIVVEAVIEQLEPKHEVLVAIERELPPGVFLATNTSALPLDKLAEGMAHPDRFGGLHFFNPPTRMRLVEVVRAQETSDATEAFLLEFAQVVGKVPVRVAASPGFVVNRILMPLLNEAVRGLEEGIADAESIDEAIRLGLNHPMGPLALADLIGLDVVVSIMDDLHGRLGDDAYAPRPALRELVEQGRLGRKTGHGFYDYE